MGTLSLAFNPHTTHSPTLRLPHTHTPANQPSKFPSYTLPTAHTRPATWHPAQSKSNKSTSLLTRSTIRPSNTTLRNTSPSAETTNGSTTSPLSASTFLVAPSASSSSTPTMESATTEAVPSTHLRLFLS